jgi:hypothetical protein
MFSVHGNVEKFAPLRFSFSSDSNEWPHVGIGERVCIFRYWGLGIGTWQWGWEALKDESTHSSMCSSASFCQYL